MKVAIMQPYFMPYLGYFQLIHSVNTFVFYDDVHYTKKGFINRNSILLNGKAHLFTIPLKDVSQNRLIKDTQILRDIAWSNQFFKTLNHSYKKAPYYEIILDLINDVFDSNPCSVSQLAMQSIKLVCEYLDLNRTFQVSSFMYSSSKELDKADRLINITKQSGNNHYINPIGGKTLYEKDYFASHNIKLSFIKNQLVPYKQFNDVFVGCLSIIDVLMFNSKEQILDMLKKYELV